MCGIVVCESNIYIQSVVHEFIGGSESVQCLCIYVNELHETKNVLIELNLHWSERQGDGDRLDGLLPLK